MNNSSNTSKFVGALLVAGGILACDDESNPCEQAEQTNVVDPTYELLEKSKNTAQCVADVYRISEDETSGYLYPDGTMKNPVHTATVCGDLEKLQINLACLESLGKSVPAVASPCDWVTEKFNSVLPLNDQEQSRSSSANCFTYGDTICNYGATYEVGFISADDPDKPQLIPSSLSFDQEPTIAALCNENGYDSQVVWKIVKPK